MATENLESKMEKLAIKRAQIEQRERLLKQKERKLETKRLIEIGRLAAKVGIDTLDSPTLAGAFIDIREKFLNPDIKKTWEENGNHFLTDELKSNDQPIIIKFSLNPSEEAKAKLKHLRFRWNNFRKEWYGYGKIEEIQNLIKGSDASVELANK